ncbi:hypothetical protein [Variovorax sp. 38R]|nr:hypothetical protein [Variovorax sp. 38R]
MPEDSPIDGLVNVAPRFRIARDYVDLKQDLGTVHQTLEHVV